VVPCRICGSQLWWHYLLFLLAVLIPRDHTSSAGWFVSTLPAGCPPLTRGVRAFSSGASAIAKQNARVPVFCTQTRLAESCLCPCAGKSSLPDDLLRRSS
jgi:hypothetical protein